MLLKLVFGISFFSLNIFEKIIFCYLFKRLPFPRYIDLLYFILKGYHYKKVIIFYNKIWIWICLIEKVVTICFLNKIL